VRADLLPSVDAGAVPSSAGLAAAVTAALADPVLAPGLAVSVVDTEDGRTLYERGASQSLIPASTAKILTAAAVLTALPPDLRLTTRVVAGAAPGEVVLVGGGDPTLAGPLAPRTVPPRRGSTIWRARSALRSAPPP
jgi:D-alanyl-D-alanine carboxypeptidase/D-alanyl-D-alanine-endopeptidase (penicillin-binding protein 4)